MKLAILALLAVTTFGQSLSLTEVPKPPDAVIAAWYKATAAEAAGKASYAVLMDQIKKAVDEWAQKQIQLTVNALVAQSQLQASCGELQLDQAALQSGDVKCVEKPKAK